MRNEHSETSTVPAKPADRPAVKPGVAKSQAADVDPDAITERHHYVDTEDQLRP